MPVHALTIERVHRPSAAEFRRRYFHRNQPVIISGWLDAWPAMTRWTPEFFRDQLGCVEVDVEVLHPGEGTAAYAAGREQVRMSFAELCARMASTGSGPLHYLGRCRILDVAPELAGDLGSLAPYLRLPAAPARVTAKLTNGPVFWMGPAGSVTPLHFDSSPNLFVQIYGRKRWTMFAPDQAALLHYPHRAFFDEVEYGRFPFMSPIDLDRPDLARFPRFREARGTTFDIGPGEVLHVPACYWHHVRTLEPSISLSYWRATAITGGYLALYAVLQLRTALRRRLRR